MSDIMQIYGEGKGIGPFKRKLYVASSVVGTAIAINKDPGAYAATESMMTVFNNAAAGSNKNTIIVPQYLRLITRVIAASGASFEMTIQTDTVNRYTSGGTTLTGRNTHVQSGVTRRVSEAVINFGDIVSPAATSAVWTGNLLWHVSDIAQSVGDIFMITFGENDSSDGITGEAATTPQIYRQSVQPVFIGSGGSMILQVLEASAATTAATFDVEFAYLEANRSDT